MPYADHDPLVTPQWLYQQLSRPDLVVVDCRWSLTDPSWAKTAYQQGHIPGAVFLDLEQDLAGPKGVHGGRHPLPSPDDWTRTMQRAGIHATSLVVAYDNDGAGASRFWWLMNFYGHVKTYVLQGGLPGWQAAGYPLTVQEPHPAPGTFVATVSDPSLIVTRDDIMRDSTAVTLIDARSPERYRGDVEPLDPRAGHIPGAINLNWQSVLEAPARFREPPHLPGVPEGLFTRKPVVVYCGSGVSACVNALALFRMGHSPRLYPGSWSDWVSYSDAPVAVGPTP